MLFNDNKYIIVVWLKWFIEQESPIPFSDFRELSCISDGPYDVSSIISHCCCEHVCSKKCRKFYVCKDHGDENCLRCGDDNLELKIECYKKNDKFYILTDLTHHTQE